MSGKNFTKTVLIVISFSIFFVYGSGKSSATPDDDKSIKIFKEQKCFNCHSILAHGIKVEEDKNAEKEDDEEAVEEGKEKRTPPDLSGVGVERNARWIRSFLKKKTTIDGRKHAKRFKGSNDELTVLSKWLENQKKPVEVPKKK